MEWVFAGVAIAVVMGIGVLIGLSLCDGRAPRLPPEPPYYRRKRR